MMDKGQREVHTVTNKTKKKKKKKTHQPRLAAVVWTNKNILEPQSVCQEPCRRFEPARNLTEKHHRPFDKGV